MQPLRHRQALAATEGVIRQRAIDLGGREAHPVALLQHLVGGHRLAVDADQVVFGLAVGDSVSEEFLDGGTLGDLDIVGEARSIVVD